MRSGATLGLALLLAVLWCGRAQTPAPLLDLPLDKITLPTGFRIELYTAEQVPKARHLALGLARDNTTIVYVSSTGSTVTALVDRDGDGLAEEVCPILQGLQTPNGIVWHQGSLYVMETPRLTRYDGIDFAVLADCQTGLTRATVLREGLPPQASHAARALGLGPDGKLYFSVAAPFNVDECTDLYCTVQRVNLDGTQMETFASGVRNVGGFAWSDDPSLPGVFFSVLERDMMGDDAPDDNIIQATQSGVNWGFPYCHWVGEGSPYVRVPGPGVPLGDDTVFPASVSVDGGPANDTLGPWCAANTPPPVQALGPHLSPLGVTFYPSSEDELPAQEGGPWDVQLWPAEYRGNLYVAEHGSWNRAEKIGYRVAAVEVSPPGQATEHFIFADGWLQGNAAWGRPVGLLVMPDGSMLVSGDSEGAIYRISYTGGVF